MDNGYGSCMMACMDQAAHAEMLDARWEWKKMLSEVAARWLLSSSWCCSTCCRSRLAISGTLRRTF